MLGGDGGGWGVGGQEGAEGPAASQSSADHGDVGLAGLRLAQSLADLQVELHEAGAGLRQVPTRTHHGEAARLAQRLVTEVDVQEGLDRVVRLVAEDVVGPQRPAEGGGRR